MKNIKISNELLGKVLGCECEFLGATTTYIQFRIKDDIIPKEVYLYVEQSSCSPTLNINLDTFIRLGKNKIIEYDFDITTSSRDTKIYEWDDKEKGYIRANFPSIVHNRDGCVVSDLKALEWVNTELEGV